MYVNFRIEKSSCTLYYMLTMFRSNRRLFWFFYLFNKLYVINVALVKKIWQWVNTAVRYASETILPLTCISNIMLLEVIQTSFPCHRIYAYFCTVKLSGVYLPILNLDLPFYHTIRCTFLMNYTASHHHQCHNLYYPRFFPLFYGLAHIVQR